MDSKIAKLLILNRKLANCRNLHTAGVASSKLASPTIDLAVMATSEHPDFCLGAFFAPDYFDCRTRAACMFKRLRPSPTPAPARR